MTNRFNRSTNSALPKNRIGAFVTEFPNMLLTTAKNVDTLTLLNYYSTEMGYRQHSAFRVRVKPRQAMANINTKLIEQKTHQHQQPVSSESQSRSLHAQVDAAAVPVHLIEDEKNVISEEEKRLLMLNKDGFRPSTVKKFTKNKGPIPSALPERKYPRNERSKVRSSTQNESDEKSFRRAKTDLNDNSIRGLNKEMSSVSLEMIQNQIDDQYQQYIKEMSSPESIQNLLMKNLTDHEFISVLKEYRKTKRLNLNTISQSVQSTNNITPVPEINEELNSSPPPLNSPRTVATTSTINLESQFLDCCSSSSANRFNTAQSRTKLNYPNYYVNYVNTKMVDHEKSLLNQSQNPIDRSTNQKARAHSVKVLNIPMFAN